MLEFLGRYARTIRSGVVSWALLFVWGAALGGVTACTTGAPAVKEKREILLQTEYHDQKVGAEISQDVAGEMGFVDDPELNGYLSEIGRRLVEHAPDRRFDYTFRIVDQWVPNAFALPGGHIYLSRGLLALTNSEDELANVMGHESGTGLHGPVFKPRCRNRPLG